MFCCIFKKNILHVFKVTIHSKKYIKNFIQSEAVTLFLTTIIACAL